MRNIRMIDRINLIAFFCFLLSTFILFYFLIQTSYYNSIIYLLKAVSQYITCVLGLILLFQFLERHKVQADPERLFERIRNLQKPVKNRILLRIKSLHNRKGKGTSEQKEPITEEDNAADSKPNEADASGLYEITAKKPNKTGAAENKNNKRKNVLVSTVYVLLQTGNAYLFLRSVFYNAVYIGKTEYSTTGYFHISALILLSVTFFIIRKFSLTEKTSESSFSAASFCAVFGILSMAAAFLLFVQTMFALDFIPWMILLYKVVCIYVVISVAISILFAIFEKEQTAWHDCQIYIPFNKGSDSRRFIELLERNTNISIKSLWSIRYFATVFPAFILAALILLLAATCVYKIEPYQEGAVYRLGSLSAESVIPPGLHLKLPWPIEKLEVYDVRREQSLQIGYKASSSGDFFWTVPHEGGEYTLLLGNGNELVAINAKLNYCIDDLYAYLTENNHPENLISEAAYQMLTKRTVSATLDSFLREDRTRLSDEMKNGLEAYSKEHKLGLKIKSFVIQSIHPAVEVADAYQGVVGASIKKNSLITAAETEAYRLTAEAEKERENTIISAEKTQTERVSAAQYEMAVYRAAYDAYRISPESFELDKYLNACEKIISGHKVYVFSPQAGMNLSNYIINNTNSSAQAIIVN